MNNGCESALNRTGWGACHYFLVGICGICTYVQAIASVIVLVVARLLVCDLKMGKHDVIIFNTTQSFGMAFGSFFFGSLADLYGRKGTISMTMVLTFCSSIALSFAQTVFLINLFIFLLGLGLAGNYIILRVYLIECLPIKRRETYLAILDILCILGYLTALGVSWAFIPSIIRMIHKKFRPSSWRVLVGIGGTPSLIMACAVSLLPQTPRFLLYQQRPEEAVTVLRQIYAINNSKHTETYPVIDLTTCIEPDTEIIDTTSFFKLVYKYIVKTKERLKKMFQLPFRRTTIFATFISVLYFPGFIWLALWNLHVLQEISKETTEKEKGHNYNCNVNFSDMAKSLLLSCQQVNDQRFLFLSCVSMTYILGETLLIIGIHVVRKKSLLILSSIVGSLAMLGVIFVVQQTMQIIFSVIFLAAYAINHTIINILIAENYPTGLRGTAMGFTKMFPHLAASAMKFITKVSCVPTIITACVILISTAVLVIPIPDLTRAPLRERSVNLDDT